MTTRQFQNQIRKNYPPILTLDNVRVILRISKRKASWMLQNGIIKCTDNGKKTRQFQIKVEDLFDYMSRVENDDPTVSVPCGLFSTKKAKTHREDTIIPPRWVHEKPPDDYALYLADKWCDCDEILRSEDIAEMTGYTRKTVQKWITEKKLKSVWTQTELITTKEWFIEFYQTQGHTIQNKCKEHILLLTTYYADNN